MSADRDDLDLFVPYIVIVTLLIVGAAIAVVLVKTGVL